jgi:hypothetical protein
METIDRYDFAVEYLTRHPEKIYDAWCVPHLHSVEGGILFENYTEEQVIGDSAAYKIAKWCEECKAGSDCDGSDSCKAMEAHSKARCEWETKRDRSRSVAWRYAWADAMLEERSKGKGHLCS